MRRFAWMIAGVLSVGLAPSAAAQEARTLGNRPVMVGDVVHRTSALTMDVDATMAIENVSTAPMVMKMHMEEHAETRIELLRAATDRKGALYRLTVVRKEAAAPMKPVATSPLQGRVFVVDPGKRSVKADGGPKADADAVAEVLALMEQLGDPFNVGAIIQANQRGHTLTVGDRMESGALSANGQPGDAHVDIIAFAPGAHGERVMVRAVGAGDVPAGEGLPMRIEMSGAGQVDLGTGWSLGMEMVGTIGVNDAPIESDGLSMHMSMTGPVSLSMIADFTTADGQVFGYVRD